MRGYWPSVTTRTRPFVMSHRSIELPARDGAPVVEAPEPPEVICDPDVEGEELPPEPPDWAPDEEPDEEFAPLLRDGALRRRAPVPVTIAVRLPTRTPLLMRGSPEPPEELPPPEPEPPLVPPPEPPVPGEEPPLPLARLSRRE